MNEMSPAYFSALEMGRDESARRLQIIGRQDLQECTWAELSFIVASESAFNQYIKESVIKRILS
jgi:hypothetical protein